MSTNHAPSRALAAALLLIAFSAAAQSTAPAAASARPAAATTVPPARPVAVPPVNPSATFQGSGPRGATPSAGAPDAETIFSSWDKDKNRSLSLDEFKAGWQRARESQLVARLANLFRSVDANHNGLLEPAEYASLPLIKRAGSAAPPMSTFDTNNSGSLDHQEYLRMVEALVRMADQQGSN